jgi:hypothetical protein
MMIVRPDEKKRFSCHMFGQGMGGVSDNTVKTGTSITDTDAKCTLMGLVSLRINAHCP